VSGPELSRFTNEAFRTWLHWIFDLPTVHVFMPTRRTDALLFTGNGSVKSIFEIRTKRELTGEKSVASGRRRWFEQACRGPE